MRRSDSGVSATAIEFLNVDAIQPQGDIRAAISNLLSNLKPGFVGRDNQSAVGNRPSCPVLDHVFDPETVQAGRIGDRRTGKPLATKIDFQL